VLGGCWDREVCACVDCGLGGGVFQAQAYAELQPSTPLPGGHNPWGARPFETMLVEMKRLKAEYPDRALIASIMEEISRWVRVEGLDGEAR
jgi:hypothetical protein